MQSRIYRVRLPAPLEAQLHEVCELAQLTYSDVMRQSLQYVLSHPSLLPEILSQHPHMLTEDTRTPAQQRAWQQNFSKLTNPSHVHQLLAEHHQRMPQ